MIKLFEEYRKQYTMKEVRTLLLNKRKRPKHLLNLIKKFLRWKSDVLKITNLEWEARTKRIGFSFYMASGKPIRYYRITIDDEEEFIGFINDPDFHIEMNKFNI